MNPHWHAYNLYETSIQSINAAGASSIPVGFQTGIVYRLEHKPEYILVENVKGFEVSETRKLLVDMLNDCNYAFQVKRM